MNFADFLIEVGADDCAAILANGSAYTYADLKQFMAGFIGLLARCGIRPGERVAILGVNSFFWIAAYLAVMKSGAVAVPLSTTLPAENLKRNLNYVHCKLLFIDEMLQAKYAHVLDGIPYRLLGDFSSEHPARRSAPAEEVTGRADVGCADAGCEDAGCEDAGCEDAALMFTSGTTAQPRVVRITHVNLIANTESIIQYLDLHRDDRIMAVLPLHYCFGASLLHTHLRVGGSIVLGNSFAYPETILEQMEATHCTGLAGVPSTYQILLRNSSFPRRSLPDLVKIQQAGGKLHNALLEELIRSHPHSRVFVMYGQTEATARLSYLPPDLLSRKLGSIGKGIPGVKLDVLKDGDIPVEPGEIGEIVASGNNISPGYLDNPEANALKFIDGRLRTGDLATVDADGYIYIVDRKDDFIKSFGYRISSYDVESCVLQIPEVVSAAAVGVEDPTAGEAVVVFAVLQTGSTCTAKDIMAHCRGRLANHMVPKQIVFLPALPVNANGKIVKAELKRSRMSE